VVGAFDRLAYDAGFRDGYLRQGVAPQQRLDLITDATAQAPTWNHPEAPDTRPGFRDTELGRIAFLDLVASWLVDFAGPGVLDHASATDLALLRRVAADPRTRTFYAQGYVDGMGFARSRALSPSTLTDVEAMRRGLRDGDAAQTVLHDRGVHTAAPPPRFDGSLGGLFYHRGWDDGVSIRRAYDQPSGMPDAIGLRTYYLLLGNPSLSLALHPVLWPPGYRSDRSGLGEPLVAPSRGV
jgi:hypothetical protein